jgi:5-enolpyruvylshikimate-3-phosphate synthase
MAFALARLIADGPVSVEGAEYVGDSFPGFAATIGALR